MSGCSSCIFCYAICALLMSGRTQAAKVPVDWEHHVISTHAVTPDGDLISKEALDSVRRNKIGLKGGWCARWCAVVVRY